MNDGWMATLAFLGLSLFVPFSMVLGARFLSVRAKASSPLKERPYECGEEPLGPTWIQFHPRYYVVAMFFVLFDLEAAFLLPWAARAGHLGAVAMAEALLFVAILLLGWLYALKKGAFEWQ